jgi:two-component system response regulator MprA
MNEQGVLLLVGVEAQQLKDRLDVSGYTTLEWGAGDRTIASDGQQPMAAIVSPGQMPQVGQLRQWFGALPILLGVNEDSIEARELCFSSGADDFWLSRSAPSDLLQRLRLHLSLQKRKEEHCSVVVVGDLQLETASGLVRRGTRLIGLTERESSLLLLLFKQRGKVVSREQILREVWNDEQGMSSNVVEVYIRYLRQKLEEGGDTRLIHTIRGRGYCLNHGVPFLKSS